MSLKYYSLPKEIKTLVFDIDNTLYNHQAYSDHQHRVLIERLAQERGEEADLTWQLIKDKQQKNVKEHGKKQSWANIFLSLGISVETSVEWRENYIKPKNYLTTDEKLQHSLGRLREEFLFLAVTNNPTKTGRKTLEILGVDSLFQEILGLDTLMKPKPNSEIFLHAAEKAQCPPSQMVSIGDRYDVDIAPALAVGMGGILCDEISGIYNLKL